MIYFKNKYINFKIFTLEFERNVNFPIKARIKKCHVKCHSYGNHVKIH